MENITLETWLKGIAIIFAISIFFGWAMSRLMRYADELDDLNDVNDVNEGI